MTTSYEFEWGVSDPVVQVQPERYTPAVMETIKEAQPRYWRLEIPWGTVAKSLGPGGYQAAGNSSTVTATARGSGVVGNPHTNGSMVAVATASGTGRVTGVAPSTTGRDWSSVDAVINDIALRTGTDVIMQITQSRPNGWTFDNFQAFCTEAAQRYGPGGPGIRTDGIYAPNAGWGITRWEMWNEENQEVFYTAAVNPVEYTGLLKAGYNGIKAVQPGAQSTVIFGGMQHVQFIGAWWGAGWANMDEVTFLRQCYAAGAHGYFDAMATHLYPYSDTAMSGTTLGGQQLPAMLNTSGGVLINASIRGSGVVNAGPGTGIRNVHVQARGTGTLNTFQPGGPVPNVFMDNFRQIQGIYALMQANGDGDKKVLITELGYTHLDTADHITLQLVADYIKQCWDILNTLPYIGIVLIYNAMDVSNSTNNDGVNGFGLLDWQGAPHPLYDWLLTTKPPLPGAGSPVITATITGAGTLSAGAAPVITATATGSGHTTASGGVITATATGSGFVSLAAQTAMTVTATITGAGFVALQGGGGAGPGVGGGGVIVTAAASGLGRVGIQPASDGDLLVSAVAYGAGTLSAAAGIAVPITATALGAGVVYSNGAEIGVVGHVSSGSLSVTATSTGSGATVAGDSGSLLVTATAHGAGLAGAVGAGNPTETATAHGTAVVGAAGTAALSVTAAATGTGVVHLFTGGSLTVTALISGSKVVVLTGAAAPAITAAVTGVGVVNTVGAAVGTVTATAVGSGVLARLTGGTLTVTAAATGVGRVATAQSSTPLTVTALATGAGVVGVVGAGSLTLAMAATGSTFTPFSVNTNQSNQPVPPGAYGCYVTLLGPGNYGGNGGGSSGNNARAGGGGGGGGARIGRDFIPAASLGPTYSLTKGTSTGGTDTTFTSGSISLTAPIGAGGTDALTGSAGVGGAGGVPTMTGITLLAASGSPGGNGGVSSSGTPGTSNTSGAGSGGSGGSGSSLNNSTGGVAGAAASGGTPTGLNGAGGIGAASNNSTQPSGVGGNYGGGGGGGGGFQNNSTGSSGNWGADGYILVEWVAAPVSSGGAPSIFMSGTSVGVLGTATGGSLTVAAAATGNGALSLIGGSGSLGVTVTATGTAQVGNVASGASTVSASITGAGSAGVAQAGTQLAVSVSALGAGQVGNPAAGTLTISASGVGSGVIGRVGSAAPTVTATGVGNGFLADVTGGASTITAAITGVGVVGLSSSGSLSVTAAGAGANILGKATTGVPLTVTATATGDGTVAAGMALVTRDSTTGYLMVSGSRFRFAGNNGDFWGLSEDTTTYGETVTGGLHITSHTATDDYFTAAVSMNTSVIRTFTSGLGVSGTFMPTLGTYDHTALEGLDYAITKCSANGIRLIAALVDDYDYYYHGKFTWCTLSGVTPDGTATQFFTNATVIANFKSYVSALLNHTNVYTGIKYKDDPVFLAWETGNELDGSDTPQHLLDWTADIAQYLKVTVGIQQLVMDGRWGITSNGAVPAAHMSNQYIDMFTEHTYDQWRTPAHMANQAAICHNYGKAFIVGEYPLTGLNQSNASIGWVNADMIAAVEGNQNIDGDMWWNLLPQGNTHGGGYATHAPGDDANMIARVTAQGNHATAMAGSTLRNATDHPKTKTLVGPDINAGLWTARSTANISGGQIVLPTSDTAYSSASVCDLSNSEMVVQLIQKNPSTGAAMCGMCAAVSPAPYGSDNVGIFVVGNTVYYRSHIGGADSDVTEPYSTSDHRWLRVRTTADATYLTAYPYAVGTIFFDTSSDGFNWTNKRTLTTTLVTTSLYPILLNWNYGSVGDSGTAIFDNFNNAPLPGPPVGKIITPHRVRSKHGRLR